MTADRRTSAPVRARRTLVALVTGVVLLLVGASQAVAWTAYRFGLLPVGLWRVLERSGSGLVHEHLAVAIGRGLAWTIGFALVALVVIGVVRQRTAHRVPAAVVGLGVLFVSSWVVARGAVQPGFDTLRPALDDVVEHAVSGGLDGRDAALPPDLAFTSVTGTVDVYRDAVDQDAVTVVVPQWTALVDDAGGYVYSPHRTPDVEMRGTVCAEPRLLEDGWWSC